MKIEEAEKLVGKKVKIILSNNFKFSGKVISVNEDTLKIIDIFNSPVSIKLSDIMVCSEDRK